jgi:hypothetical protein
VFQPLPDEAKETIQELLEREARRQCGNEKRKMRESRNNFILNRDYYMGDPNDYIWETILD